MLDFQSEILTWGTNIFGSVCSVVYDVKFSSKQSLYLLLMVPLPPKTHQPISFYIILIQPANICPSRNVARHAKSLDAPDRDDVFSFYTFLY